MNTIEVKVLDYYNKPEYYPYMPKEIFETLEGAFLNDTVSIGVPKEQFENMLLEFNRVKKCAIK